MKGPKFPNGLSIPRHVQLPPEVIDAMPSMSKAEFRVIIAVLAHGEGVPLSFSELQRITGLSRPSVRKGIADAMERGVLERSPVTGLGGQETYAYFVAGSGALKSPNNASTGQSETE